MIKKTLLLIYFCSLISFAQILVPKIYVTPTDFDFGTIEQGKVVTHNYVVVNNGTDTLKIYDVRPGCGCTAAKPEKNILLPGESTKIKIDFNSEGREGQQEKYVSILTNDPKQPQYQIKFHGIIKKKPIDLTVNSRISFKETDHNFGKVKEGAKVDYTFTFTNVGKVDLVVNDVKTNCGCTAALISSKLIKPGKEGTIKVELDTKDREGKMSRNITIYSNDPEEPSKIISIFAEVIKQ
ncbi:MAG: DUF1573 domain-containing protein [Bacteroidota bacterium]|nr:DUF1573 domain-containing protein [Bacteroidota bacterium]